MDRLEDICEFCNEKIMEAEYELDNVAGDTKEDKFFVKGKVEAYKQIINYISEYFQN